VIKDAAGNFVYDENAEGVKVWVNYLASIGVKVFSPLVELWIFMAFYLGMRAGLIIDRFRRKKGTGPQPAQPGKEGEKSPGQKSAPSPGTPAPPAAPGTPPPPPPSTAEPPLAPGEIPETGMEEI